MTVKLFIERQRIKRRLKHINKLEALRDSPEANWRPHEIEYLDNEIKTRYKNITVF